MVIKKLAPWLLIVVLICGVSAVEPVNAKPAAAKVELFGKRKKFKGYQKPKSKKILGIFKRRTDCGCPSH